MVPVASLVFMGVSLVIAVGLPVLLFFIFRKKCGAKLMPAMAGAVAFIVFAMILENALHGIVLRPDASGNAALAQRPFLYVLYGCLAAGVFEETARFVSFRFLRRRYGDIGCALSYGVGHGGFEAVWIVGFTMINNLALAYYVNSGTLDTLLASAQDAATAAQFQAGADLLIATPSYMFLLGGVERVAALAAHVALSVLVWYAVQRRRSVWLYPAAILLHALFNVPAALAQIGVIQSIWLTEALILILAGGLAALAVTVHRRQKGLSRDNRPASSQTPLSS